MQSDRLPRLSRRTPFAALLKLPPTAAKKMLAEIVWSKATGCLGCQGELGSPIFFEKNIPPVPTCLNLKTGYASCALENRPTGERPCPGPFTQGMGGAAATRSRTSVDRHPGVIGIRFRAKDQNITGLLEQRDKFVALGPCIDPLYLTKQISIVCSINHAAQNIGRFF